jgi:hypothetical protein
MPIRQSRAAASLLLCASLAMLALLIHARPAHAETFGELAKTGTFGEGLGQFDFPAAVAADPEGNSVFVLDAEGPATGTFAGPASFRVQKFSSSLALEASASIPTPEEAGHRQWVVDIAVDSKLKRLYVLEATETPQSGPYEYVARRIYAYSTEPSGATLPQVGSGPLYSFPEVTSGSLPAGTVAEPVGLAVDPKTDALVVLGRDGEKDTLLEQISSAGVPGEAFDDSTEEQIASHEHSATSLAIGPNEEIYLTVAAANVSRYGSALPAVLELKPSPSFATPTVKVIHQDTGSPETEPRPLTGGEVVEQTHHIGAQIALSSNGATVYAAEVGNGEGENVQVKPKEAGNYAIRGMSTSETPEPGQQQVVLGGAGKASSTCRIASQYNAIAAGGEGVVYVLDEGSFEGGGVGHTLNFGFDLIKFGPGGSGCPKPSASFKVNEVEAGTVQVKKGALVTFELVETLLNGEKPSEVKWDLEGTDDYVAAGDTVTHEYLKPGVYTIGLNVLLEGGGVFGEPPLATRTLEVVAPLPIANFEASTQAPKPGEPVTFNGAGSLDETGSCSQGHGCHPTSTLKSYEWSFGDGKSEITTGPTFERSFANTGSQPRSEGVTLVVTNNEGVRSEPSEQKLTIQGAPESNPPSGGGGGVPGPPLVSPPPTKEAPVITHSQPKSTTKAEKLANALKTCKKLKGKHKRESCEKLAKRRYGPKSASKKKKKKR